MICYFTVEKQGSFDYLGSEGRTVLTISDKQDAYRKAGQIQEAWNGRTVLIEAFTEETKYSNKPLWKEYYYCACDQNKACQYHSEIYQVPAFT